MPSFVIFSSGSLILGSPEEDITKPGSISFFYQYFFSSLYNVIKNKLLPFCVFEDFDECSKISNGKYRGCDQVCLNSIGSFRCECRTAWKVDPENNKQCIGMFRSILLSCHAPLKIFTRIFPISTLCT